MTNSIPILVFRAEELSVSANDKVTMTMADDGR